MREGWDFVALSGIGEEREVKHDLQLNQMGCKKKNGIAKCIS